MDTDILCNVKEENSGLNKKRKCFMCGRLAGLVCSCCGEFWFCCQEHGRLHFREEEGICFPWKVDEKAGG